MPHLSRRHLHRLIPLHARLMTQVEALDAIPGPRRRRATPKPLRSTGRRLIEDARRLLPLPARVAADAPTPGALAASTLVALDVLNTLIRQHEKDVTQKSAPTYARRFSDAYDESSSAYERDHDE